MANANPRVLHTQQVHYFRKRVNFNDANIGTGVIFGTFPANAQVTDAICRVITAFNAATTNVLTVGTNASTYNNILAAADITEGTPGSYRAPVAGLIGMTVDTDLYVMYTQTGTAATTGQADIVVSYVPNNDG